MDLYCFSPPVFFMTPMSNYILFFSTFLSKKIARGPGGHKRFMLTKLGGGGDRLDPNTYFRPRCVLRNLKLAKMAFDVINCQMK